MTPEQRQAYAIEVETPFGPRRVGHLYADKEVAESWVRFVKAAWHGMKTRTVAVDIGGVGVEYRELQRYPGYRFGSDGTIWSQWRKQRGSERGCWTRLKPSPNSKGYLIIGLRTSDGQIQRSLLAHRLICEAFHGPCPEGFEVRHYPDRTKTNIAASNLLWGTRSDNLNDKWEQGTMPAGESHGMAKMTEAQILDIRRRFAAGEKQTHIAAIYGKRQSYISAIVNKKVWSWLS